MPLYTRTPRDPDMMSRRVARPEVLHWFSRPGGEGHTGGDVDWFTVDGAPDALPITRPRPAAMKREVIPGRLDYPGAPKPVPLANTAVRLSESPGSIRHRAPLVGEHTDEVLTELGYTPAEISTLRESGVV